jgi:UDP:flavonoid glycosyltransferase YjiC (YdhE family)
MARFVFLSHARFGHVDLGGWSYLKTAVALGSRGHDVVWVTTAPNEPLESRIDRSGVPRATVAAEPLKLGADHDPGAVARSVRTVAQLLREREAGVLVADRTLAAAGLAARLAGLPWAAFGTDGHSWHRARRNGQRVRERGVHEKRAAETEELYEQLGLPAGEESRVPPSVWLRSPYLTVSFFPAELWHDDPRDRLPQAHFVGGTRSEGGSGSAAPERLLVAGGNTWAAGTARAVAGALGLLRERLSGLEIELLTGRADLTDELAGLPGLEGVTVATWRDYADAFRGARLAVGHGGTSFLWQCLADAVPALVVNPAKGDQTFNATRVERLGLGRVLREGDVAPPRIAEEIVAALADPAPRRQAQAFSSLLGTGGGYEAAASLLETLAATRRSVTACPATPCCCGGSPAGRGGAAAGAAPS